MDRNVINKNKSCIEIRSIFYNLHLSYVINKNKSCIEMHIFQCLMELEIR